MRRSKLTGAERLDLGLLLAMLVLACLCLTAISSFKGPPILFAPAPDVDPKHDVSAIPPAVVESAQSSVELLDLPSVPAQEAMWTQPATPKIVKPAKIYKVYGGHKYELSRSLNVRVTAYAPDPRCTWPYPGTTTASGLSVKSNGGRLVAADTALIPLHALVAVPGYAGGQPVPVLDRGGAIKGHRLDVLLPTFEQAKAWGSRIMSIKVYMPVQ